MGNYVFSTPALRDALNADARDGGSRHDIGGDLMPRFVATGDAHAYDFSTNVVPGEPLGPRRCWREVGTIDAYYDAQMDLVTQPPAFALFNEAWPVHTWFPAALPAMIAHDPVAGPSSVNASILGAGVTISGARVYQSVLSPGVVVEPGADVEGAVLLDGVRVGRGARVRHAVIDQNVSIPAHCTVGFDLERDLSCGLTVSSGGVVVVPQGYRFGARTRL